MAFQKQNTDDLLGRFRSTLMGPARPMASPLHSANCNFWAVEAAQRVAMPALRLDLGNRL